jgi:hypothetical protein
MAIYESSQALPARVSGKGRLKRRRGVQKQRRVRENTWSRERGENTM